MSCNALQRSIQQDTKELLFPRVASLQWTKHWTYNVTISPPISFVLVNKKLKISIFQASGAHEPTATVQLYHVVGATVFSINSVHFGRDCNVC